jgi:hypothetical protein
MNDADTTPPEYKFRVNDRVVRDENVFKSGSRVMHGMIQEAYSKTSHYLGIHYPELYDVAWDNGEVGHGYLPHGLEKE